METDIVSYQSGDYNYYFDRPEIFVTNISNLQVAFIVVYHTSPNYLKTCYNTHAHNSFELQSIDEGNVENCIDNSKNITLNEGDILLLPPNMLHCSSTNPNLFKRYCINFCIISDSEEKANHKKPGNECRKSIFSNVHDEIVFKNDEIRRCMKKIYEIGHDDVSQMPRTLAYLQLIFLEVENKLAEIMKISNIHEDREALTPAQIDNYRRWIIDIYVSNYYMCKNHAEILASVLSLSQRQTLRIVNNLTGHTINDLILKQRMNVGIAAIKNTDFTLKQISEMVGYETYSGFYIAFNKFFGFSPESLRQKINSALIP